jgi:hypothetical protein
VQTLDALGSVPVTCEIVLAEACHQLRKTRHARRAVESLLRLAPSGCIRLEPVLAGDTAGIWALMAKYWPRMDLGDAAVVHLSQLYPAAKVVTIDADFTVYRPFRTELLPCISPPR